MARKLLLENDHIEGINTYEIYRKHGGYRAVEKVLKTMTPQNVIEEVKKSGLRGRGGAGFPTGIKWSFIAKPEGVPRYLVCNADESEPGTFKDRYLMERIPHLLVEGMIISSFALGVNTSYIYVRGEYFYIIRILEKAIAEAYAKGWLGKNILGSGYDLDLYVQCGAAAYICGEETALLESLEGKRGNPRIKPPFPAVKGLWECPTIINNVETIASVVPIINEGGAAYASIGIGKSTGTKLISASGHIKKPGVHEIEMGLPVDEFIYCDDYCGGILNNKKLKAVIAGGSSVPVLPADLILSTAAGEKRFFVSGHLNKPGMYEIDEMDAPMEEFIYSDECFGGMITLKLGSSVPIMPAELILKTASGAQRLITYESMADGGFETGTMLGSGGFIVMDESVSIVKNLYTLMRFYHHESCGQCSPCRQGTGWIERILHKILDGHGTLADIDLLWDIQRKIFGNTICPLGDAAAMPVASAIRHFRSEFEEYVKNPSCIRDVKYYFYCNNLEEITYG